MSGSGGPRIIRRNAVSLALRSVISMAFIILLLTGNVALTEVSGNTSENTYEDLQEKTVLPLPYYNQGDTNWCLYYCMAMIFNYNNHPVEPWEIAAHFNSGHSETFSGQYNQYDNSLEEYAKNEYSFLIKRTLWGYNLGQFDCGKFNRRIIDSIDRAQPVILAFQYDSPEGIKKGHACVATGYDNEHIYITDPSGAITREVFGIEEKCIAVPVTWDDFNEKLVSRISITNMAFTIEALDDAPDSTPPGSIYITDRSNSNFSCLSFTNRSDPDDIALLRFDGTYDNGYTIVSKGDTGSEREPSGQDMMSLYFTVSNPASSEKEYSITSELINTNTGEVIDSFYFDSDISVNPFETISKGINYSNQLQSISAEDYTIVLTLLDNNNNIVDSVHIGLCFA